jgi:NTP pyrophosphatase (non-canonical NTP hydrolase)
MSEDSKLAIESLKLIIAEGNGDKQARLLSELLGELQRRVAESPPSMMESVIRSHVAICKAKGMGEKDAYGQDPALYYSAAISAEAGEQLNKIVRGLRNGNNPETSKKAVVSELPDVFIYGFVLAHVLDLDITKLVADKVEVVIQRAIDGYYGGELPAMGDVDSARP